MCWLGFWSAVVRRRPRPSARRVDEPGPRIVPTVTATFAHAAGMPSVLGDGADNTVTVSRDGPGKRRGRRRQNPGARPGRSDISSPDEASGALPAANLFGRAGNDALTGGPGNDQRYGQAGNDTLLGGNGHGVPNGGPGRDRLNAAPGDDTVIQ